MMARITKFGKREVAVEVARLLSVIKSRVFDEMDRQRLHQNELAHRLGVSTDDLQKLLDGDVPMTLLTMVHLGNALNILWDIHPWSASEKGGAR